MNADIISTFENEEEGTRAVISNSYKGGFNVIMLDSDSGESLGGKIGIVEYDAAVTYAKFIINA